MHLFFQVKNVIQAPQWMFFCFNYKVLIHMCKWAYISIYDGYLHNIFPSWLLIIVDSWNLHGHPWLPIFSYSNSLGELLPALCPSTMSQSLKHKLWSLAGVEWSGVMTSLCLVFLYKMSVWILKKDLKTGYQSQTTHRWNCLLGFGSISTS